MIKLLPTLALILALAVSILACEDFGFGSQVEPYATRTREVDTTPVTPVFQPSSDAYLRHLSVNPIDIDQFSTKRRRYRVEVTSDTYFTTISAIPNFTEASIRINGELTKSDQAYYVPLDHGTNVAEVSVTAEDALTTRSYFVEIERAFPNVERNAPADFSEHYFSAAGSIKSIWSDGETMWVLQNSPKLLAFRLSSKARTPQLNFNLVRENLPIHGLWSDGSILWVGRESDRLFAYDVNDGGRVRDAEIKLQKPNRSVSGIWADRFTIWISDFQFGRIFAYDIAQKIPKPWMDIQLVAENDSPGGIWSDGTTLWVVDGIDDKIYAYKLSDHSRVPAFDFDFLLDGNEHSGTSGTFDIWSDGETMWVVEESGTEIFAYDMPDYDRALEADTSLVDLQVSSAGDVGFNIGRNTYVVGVNQEVRRARISATTSNPKANIRINGVEVRPAVEHPVDLNPGNNNVYIAVTAADGTTTENFMLRIDRASIEPAGWNSEKDFNTLYNAGNHSPNGIWSDGTTMWVGDKNDGKIYAYNLDDMSHQPQKDLNVKSESGVFDGIWSDGEIMWTVTDVSKKLVAYNISDNEPRPERDIDVSDDSDPRSVYRRHYDAWADGETLWIVNHLDSIIHAHRWSNPERRPERDLHIPETDPRAIWTDRTHIWVLDETSGNIHAYTIADAQRVPEYDIPRPQHDPSQIDAQPTGIWSDGKTMWVSTSGNNPFKPDPRQSKIFAYNMPTVETDP